jgi:hypothetical protein
MLEKGGGDLLDHSLENGREIMKEKNNLQQKEGKDWVGHILSRNCLLKQIIERKKWRAEEEEDVNSFRVALRKREDTRA